MVGLDGQRGLFWPSIMAQGVRAVIWQSGGLLVRSHPGRVEVSLSKTPNPNPNPDLAWQPIAVGV